MHAIVAVPSVLADAPRWADLAGFLARLTLVLGLGHLLLAAVPRAAAARRHLIAMASLAAMVALPVAAALLPAWRLPILPAGDPPARPQPTAPAVRAERPARVTSSGEAARPAAPAPAIAVPAADVSPAIASKVATGSAPSPPLARAGWPARALLAACAVAALLVLRVVTSLLAAARLARRVEPVDDAATRAELEWARERIGVRAAVGLGHSARISMPLIAGIVRPVLVLPSASRAWPAGRLRIVFLHELAHVRRGDCAALLLARLASALFWYHPLAWTLAREARREAERACDDLVLASGVRATDYAGELLRIGAMAGPDPLAGATLAVARRSSLEARLVSILRAGARRAPATRLAVASALLGAALCLIPIVSVRVVAAPRRGAPAAAVPTTVTRADHAVCETRATSVRAAPTLACGTATATASATAGAGAGVDAVFAGSKSGDGWFSEARTLYEAKRYDEAAEAYLQAARAGHRPAISCYNAACSYALDGQSGPALGALSDARDAGFDDVPLLSSDSDLNSIRADHRFQLILMAIRHTGKAEAEQRSAAAQLKALESSSSTDAGTWKSTGMSLLRAGDAARAAQAFGREYQLDKSPSALYNQACAYAQNRDRDKALEALGAAIQAGFGDDQQVAEDSDLASLHDDPRFAALVELTRDLTLFGPGMDDEDRDSWRAALPRFEKVTREHGGVGRAWFNLGFARLKAGEVTGSRDAFTRALELGYRPATTMYNLACVAAQSGDRDGAMQWLQKAQDAGMELENSAFTDKDLDPLRSDPRFKTLIGQLRDRVAAKKKAEKYKD